MQECKFKVGDIVKRVEWVDYYSNSPNNGQNWKISEVQIIGGAYFLKFEGSSSAWEAKCFALVPHAEEQKSAPQSIVHKGENVVSAETPQTTQWTDKHYDAYYTLTQKDIEAGKVKIDPYFVAKQWRLGEKDDTGVLFHNLKNISRYGEKNSKEREIKALYAQIKRLAELEEVEL